MMIVAAGAKPQQEPNQRQPERRREDLGVRYGAIGISAVAAAARYAGDGKNKAHNPVAPLIEERFEEISTR